MIPCDADNIIKQYDILINELKKYNAELLDKPRILAITKADMLDDELIAEMKKECPKDIPTVFISAAAQKNIDMLKDMLWNSINSAL
jgi:GTP-binding protein